MRDVTAAEWRKAWTGHAWWLLAAFGVFLSLLASVGFATQADAQSVCARLSAGGFACLVVRD